MFAVEFINVDAGVVLAEACDDSCCVPLTSVLAADGGGVDPAAADVLPIAQNIQQHLSCSVTGNIPFLFHLFYGCNCAK